jgi:hypothetical protein
MTDKKLIDDCFYVVKARFLWHSYDKEDKGLVSALSEETCIRMTRFYLKGLQEGWDEKTSRVVNSGLVGGKL